MSGALRLVVAVLCDESGASLAEYAMLAATLGTAMIAGAGLIHTASGTVVNANATGWQTAALSPP